MHRDYCEGLRDSLDLVPIGAWNGNGRKVGWLSPFLMAAWDPETETYQSVCRCMSGFTDAFYTEVRQLLFIAPAMPCSRWLVECWHWGCCCASHGLLGLHPRQWPALAVMPLKACICLYACELCSMPASVSSMAT